MLVFYIFMPRLFHESVRAAIQAHVRVNCAVRALEHFGRFALHRVELFRASHGVANIPRIEGRGRVGKREVYNASGDEIREFRT